MKMMASGPSIPRFAVFLVQYLPYPRQREFYKAMMAVSFGFPFQACATRIADLSKDIPSTLLLLNNFTRVYDGFFTIENSIVYYTNREGVKKDLETLKLEHAKSLRHLDRLRYAHEWRTIDVEIEDSGDEEDEEEEDGEYTDSEEEQEDSDDDDDIPRLGAEDSDTEEELDGEEIQPEFPVREL